MAVIRHAAMMVVSALGLGMAQGQAAPSAVPGLDLNKFVGSWYEIARLPDKAEKQCRSDALMLYTVRHKPGQFALVSSCRLGDETTLARNQNGRSDDEHGGELKVRTIWPFYAKHWVLAVGPQYKWALVGMPNHKQLWILSRSKSLPAEQLAEIKARAAAEGFNTDKLIDGQGLPQPSTRSASGAAAARP